MKNKLIITFFEGVLEISGLEEKINFIKNLPIKTVPSNEILDVYFGPFGATIYPTEQKHITYEAPEEIKGCDVRPDPGLLTISRKTGESKEYYSFKEFKDSK